MTLEINSTQIVHYKIYVCKILWQGGYECIHNGVYVFPIFLPISNI